ncbi:MAG: glycosyltransferase [Pseudorhodobacter sp.]
MATETESASRPLQPPPRIVILMAVYNGAAHLAAQLDSFAAQTDPDWDLIASEDGSQDDSPALLAEAAARWRDGPAPHRVTVLEGPRRGLVRNFFHLIASLPEGSELAALSDQDDVWFPDKLARARSALATLPEGQPGLYCARSLICDAGLQPYRVSPLFRRPPSFRNALVQSAGGGNTMMLNRAAIDIVRAAVTEAGEAAVHDWWLYQIVTACGGTILRDPEPVLHYRQHGGNAIGANTTARGRIHRMLFIMGRRFAAWNEMNLRALDASRHRFTPEAARILDLYARARRGRLWGRLGALRASGVYRQHRTGTLALFLACLAGRL